MSTATIIGSGPNGLSAAIVLAASGVRTTVLERNGQIGGGCSTAEVTQPGFLHDLGSSTYPLGAASPFYASLPFTIPWIQPHAAFAHPLDKGTAVVLEHSIEETIDQLDACEFDFLSVISLWHKGIRGGISYETLAPENIVTRGVRPESPSPVRAPRSSIFRPPRKVVFF